MDKFQQYIDNQEKNNQQTQEQLNALYKLVNNILVQMKNDSDNSKYYYQQLFELLMKNNDNQQILIDIAKQNGITEEKILAVVADLKAKVEAGQLT